MDSADPPHDRYFMSRRGAGMLAALALLMTAGVLWAAGNGQLSGDGLLAVWHTHRADLLAAVHQHPFAASLLILLLHALLAMLALPGASLLMLATGAAYGPLLGTLLCLTGCTVGASACMLAARHFLRPLAQRRFGARLADIDRRISADGAAYLFALRLVPVVPFALTNVAAGLSSMTTWTFTWVSFLGMLAGTFVYVNAGTEMAQIRTFADLFSPSVLLSLAALALLPWLLKRLHDVWQSRAEKGA